MANLPSLYEHYTANGVHSGLATNANHFILNDKNITIYSGAMHYFRVHPKYWRDRLRKMRAAGLNAVETYVPWNLHEPEPGTYDFGKGGTDFQEFLDIKKFLEIAKEEDLFAIVRPGPYICAEWDFGGMPSWLLRTPNIKLRTSDHCFMDFVSTYFATLFKILSALQFINGGPIIAFQIENEYGNVKETNKPIDINYLQSLKELYKTNHINALLFTSDTPSNGNDGVLPGILNTANFQNDSIKELDLLKQFQPHKPFMVMEFWTGWFDHWGEQHHKRSDESFAKELALILNYPASVNFYMFHGGTNWGFMNGANALEDSIDNGGYTSDISSYDYDAPLSEAGDYTDKYYTTQKLIKAHNLIKTHLPKQPSESFKKAYPQIEIIKKLNLQHLINQIPHNIPSKELQSMELLPINNNAGQSYGYIIYRKSNINIASNSTLKINGRVCDTLLVLINGKLISKILKTPKDMDAFGYWKVKDSELNLGLESHTNATIDLLVENWGRVNYGKLNQFNQKKGLWQGDVLINNQKIHNWNIFPLEFKSKFTNSLNDWVKFDDIIGPGLFMSELNISEEPADTFIDMRKWTKGILIVNGFVLSRYCHLGPQQTIYLPAPLLKKGKNTILIFEHFVGKNSITFVDAPIFHTLT